MRKLVILLTTVSLVAVVSATVSAQPQTDYYGPCTVAELFWCSGDHQPCTTYEDCAAADPPQTCEPSLTGPLPPPCTYLTSEDYHAIKDAGGAIVAELDIMHFGFRVSTIQWGALQDPPLPYDIEEFESDVRLHITGLAGTFLEGYDRVLEIPATCRVKTDVRGAGSTGELNPEMLLLDASLTGDADFESLLIRAGTEAGLGLAASTGSTTLTLRADGGFQVDSFFDIHYQIDLVGAVGSPFDGMDYAFTGLADMQAVGNPIPAVSQWGLAVLTLLVLAAATIVLRRRTALAT